MGARVSGCDPRQERAIAVGARAGQSEPGRGRRRGRIERAVESPLSPDSGAVLPARARDLSLLGRNASGRWGARDVRVERGGESAPARVRVDRKLTRTDAAGTTDPADPFRVRPGFRLLRFVVVVMS